MTNPAKEKIRWGILSTANIATKVARGIDLAENAELIAIASRDQERASSWAAEHGPERAYGSYEALLEDPEIDAVYIPLPPSMHREWTIKAAQHSKHILCEKPLAVSAAQAREMAAVCKENKVQLMDGVMWVHHERTEEMKNLLGAGSLGDLRRVTSAFSFNGNLQGTDNIRVQKQLGAGSLGDLGYYCVRASLWAFDEMPTRVYATARFYNEVVFNLSGLLWFTEERLAAFDCGFDTVSRKWLEVAGTTASLVCDDFVVPHLEALARYWIHGSGGKADSSHSVQACIQEVRMIERFSDMVRSGELEEDWPSAALATMQVCDALLESAQQDKITQLSTP